MIRSEFMQEYEGINFLLEELEERKQLLLEKRTRLENMRECSVCYGIFPPEEIDKVENSDGSGYEWICIACRFQEKESEFILAAIQEFQKRKKETSKISKEEFLSKVGREPHNDDLERVNCSEAGKLGHQTCGWCSNCSLPVFECNCEVIRNEDGSYRTKKKYLFL